MNIPNDLPIVNSPSIPLNSMILILKRRAVINAEAIAVAYAALGMLSGVGSLCAFAQGAKETDWFRSSRWIQSSNPAGLGATDDKTWGGHFLSPIEGITAQYAHLLAYARTDKQMTSAQLRLLHFDPRLEAVTKEGYRGAALRWVDLSTKWAPSKAYGSTIIEWARDIAAAM